MAKTKVNGFQTVAAIFLQAIGKPVKSAIVTLSRQIVFLIPVAVVLPIYMGVTGVLWAGPVADGLAFILAFILIGFEIKKLNHMPAAAELNSENPQENAQGNTQENAQEETQENTVQITSEIAKEELGKRSARSSRSLRKRARASLSADVRIMSCGTRQTV